MSPTPTISIIVPVYNGERFISDCLQSLFNQTHTPHEIIIVDDGSTDATPHLIPPPAQRIATPGRTGAGAARNLGAQHATGDYLLFTDADVVAPPDWVEKTRHVIQKQNVRCGGGGYCGPVEDTFIQWFAHHELVWRRKNFHGSVETLVSNNLFCQRTLFNEIGGFPETYRTASSEDMEFSWSVSRQHRLWWEQDNGVFHNFTPTLNAYLNQQKRFAIDAIPMLLKRTQILTGKTHHPPTFYLEIFLTALTIGMLSTAFLLPILLKLALLPMIAIPLLNHGLLTAMVRQNRSYFRPSIGLIYLRNLTILYGGIIGIKQCLMQRES